MRSYANYQRQKNQRAIFVLPSDRIAEAADSNGAPQRDCRYEAGDTKCLEDLHWACAAPIPPREVIPVCSSRTDLGCLPLLTSAHSLVLNLLKLQ